MKRVLYSLCLCLSLFLAACGGGGGGGGGGMSMPLGMALPVAAEPVKEAAPAEAPKPVCTVALYGDSIMHGGYSLVFRIAEPPAKALARVRPMLTVTDHSQNGDSATARMLTFLSDDLDGARVVVIEHGWNDAGNGMPYETAMRAMLERVKALKAIPVVTGIINPPGGLPNRDAYDAIARRLAGEYGAVFADWGSVDIGADDTHDGVHPKQALSLRLVDKLAAAIDTALPGCGGAR